jgi:hypothetical protein
MTQEYIESLRRWTVEATSVLHTVELLVGYFGTEDEAASLQRALSPARFWVKTLQDVATGKRDPVVEKVQCDINDEKFLCDRQIAQIISPAIQLLNEPIPEFLGLVKSQCDEHTHSAIKRMFGMFSGTLYTNVSDPIWHRYPELRPEGA